MPSVGGSINIVTNTTNADGLEVLVSCGWGMMVITKGGFSLSTGLLKWMGMCLFWEQNLGDGYIQGTDFVGYSYFINVSKS